MAPHLRTAPSARRCNAGYGQCPEMTQPLLHRPWNNSSRSRIERLALEGNRVMASADEYRRHASECVRLAQEAQTASDKALLLRMAETWLRLAEQAETREPKT
jgi:hypothetical protein